jgi:hypothetical protein
LIDVLPYVLASCVMAGGMVCVTSVGFGSNINLLIGQTLLGACLYVSLCWVFHLPAFLQLKSVVQVELERLRLWDPA